MAVHIYIRVFSLHLLDHLHLLCFLELSKLLLGAVELNQHDIICYC